MTKKKKNSKGTKAIFLDAKDNTLSYVYIKHYTDIYKHCRYGTFTTVNIAKGDVMYVDDEGLINGTDFGFDIDAFIAATLCVGMSMRSAVAIAIREGLFMGLLVDFA